jgi:sec-independent protein translocase protein TatA
MFGSMGITELVLILFIVLIIFGAGKLPQLGEGLGKAIKGFKKSVHEADAIELEAQRQEEAQPGAMPAGVPPGPLHGAVPPTAGPVISEPPKVSP